MPNEDERLSHEEAAAELGVSTKTLTSYRERGLIVAEAEPQGLNVRYWYTTQAVVACEQRVRELREQR
jgi:DNA-binding transcriptional MerR regulator